MVEKHNYMVLRYMPNDTIEGRGSIMGLCVNPHHHGKAWQIFTDSTHLYAFDENIHAKTYTADHMAHWAGDIMDYLFTCDEAMSYMNSRDPKILGHQGDVWVQRVDDDAIPYIYTFSYQKLCNDELNEDEADLGYLFMEWLFDTFVDGSEQFYKFARWREDTTDWTSEQNWDIIKDEQEKSDGGEPEEPTEPDEEDVVQKPSHYALEDGSEVLDHIYSVLGKEGFKAYSLGNAIKYLGRAGKKDATVQDLRKAQEYIGYIINVEETGNPKHK